MRYKVNNGSLEALSSKLPINPLPAEIENFKNGDSWVEENNGFLYIYVKINSKNILINKAQLPYLIFSSDSSFTLSVSNPRWDGTIEYSLDKGNIWLIWDGTQLSGDENNPIYLRGIENTRISGSYKWSFTGKYITGNIETLLDYQTIASGNHPTMSSSCYSAMFVDCTSLIIPPELPATTLASYCYSSMFNGCISLTILPKLPATTLASYCYMSMFQGCTSLKLSTTQDSNVYKYPYRIPILGTGTDATAAMTSMFSNTGGTFTGIPTINTTYYTDHQPI